MDVFGISYILSICGDSCIMDGAKKVDGYKCKDVRMQDVCVRACEQEI